MLEIIYQDQYLVAINKPSGLLVHRSLIDRHETRFALQLVRDQIDQHVYPVHRLDKPTSGALVFALSSDIARDLSKQFSSAQSRIRKEYLAVVRGHAPNSGTIDHPLTEELDKIADKQATKNKLPQPATTHFECLETTELNASIDRYPTSRYSLVRCQPETGRKHQIRRHLKHIAHPIIGDAKHGKGIHNRYFKDYLNAGRLLLHASSISFQHPVSKTAIRLQAGLDETMANLFNRFGWQAQTEHYRASEQHI